MKKILFLTLVGAMLAGLAVAQVEVVAAVDQGNGNTVFSDCVKNGNYGMRVTASSPPAPAFVEATPPQANFANETALVSEFWFRPGTMDLSGGRKHQVMLVTPGDASPKLAQPFRLQYKETMAGAQRMAMRCRVDCGAGTCPTDGPGVVALDPNWNLLRATWSAGTGAGDGVCQLERVESDSIGSETISIAVTQGRTYDGTQYTGGGVKLGFSGINFIDPAATGYHCFDDFLTTRSAP